MSLFNRVLDLSELLAAEDYGVLARLPVRLLARTMADTARLQATWLLPL